MVVNASPENAKKRKKDDIDLNEIIQARDVCTQDEASPKKSLKLAHPVDDAPSTQTSQDSESSEDSQELSDSSLVDTVPRDQDGGCSQKIALLPPSQLPQQQSVVDSQIQDQWVLKLAENQVFTRLLLVFSQVKLPDKITYKGEGYNLTAAYDEFWKTFYSLSYYSKGNDVKVPNVQSLIELELKSVVNILKRGWEDERYWPKKLSRPFLESCLFEELDTNSIKPEMFLKYIETSDELLIHNQDTVDENVLEVLKKYCSANTISIGDDIKGSCIKAAHEIFVINMKPVIDIWRKELTGLMPKSTFDFLMNPIPKPHLADAWDDMHNFSAPHAIWHTFFLGWPEDKVKYYFHSLANGKYDSTCNLCGDSCFDAKHFLCSCDNLLETLRSERHDAVLNKLLSHIDLAIKRQVDPYFSKGTDWNVLTSHQNVPYVWPEEMSILKTFGKYPHIVVYSLSPEKRALVIEPTISWEHWLYTGIQKERKTAKYWIIKEELEKIGFEVEFKVIVLGSRGVLVADLYDLLEQIFGMKHSEISKAHEEISQEILNIPYQSKYYKDVMDIIK